MELSWVLTRAYGVARDPLAETIEGLLDSGELVVQHADVVRTGAARLRAGADFADAVIAELGRVAGCVKTVTFDRRAARHAGMVAID